MQNTILELEKKMFKYRYMNDIEWLDKTIHNNFIECGKSGIFFNKKETMESLNGCTEDRKIEVYNYECEKIDKNTYLVHYITKSENLLIYRTSIWVMEDCLKLFFHQASKLELEIKLIKF